MSDLIVKGAGEIKDGLYNIKDGKLFKYKANGGTVRTYPIVSADSPTGYWIKNEGMAPPEFTGRYVCSICGDYALMSMPYGSKQELSNFCPNCGARMESDADGSD